MKAWKKVAAFLGLSAVGVGTAVALSGGDSEPVGGTTPDDAKPETKGEPVPYPGWTGVAPRGKGIFVYDLDDATGPENLAQRLQWLGMDWVMLQTHRAEDGKLRNTDTSAKLQEHITAVREAGIAVAFWGWPEPDRVDDWTERALAFIETYNPVGYVVNAEKPWKGHAIVNANAARVMMEALKAELGTDRGLGFTSYGGGPPNHPNFPWAEFAAFSDFGMPQIYDMSNNLARQYPQRSVGWWSEDYRIVVPAWSAGPSKTPDMMKDIQDRTPLPDAAACWWSFRSAIASPGRAAAVRSYSLEREDLVS